MARIDVVQQRMATTMPLPEPLKGSPRMGRIRLMAAAIAGNPIATLGTPRTAAAWTTDNPVLAMNTLGIESDTLKFKVGDGSTAWASLSYIGTVVDPPVASGDVPGHEAQVANAIQQLQEGAIMGRIASHDASGNPIAADSWDTTQAAYWAFAPEADPDDGAAGTFLDWWGSMLQVPRNAGETDASYAQRIPQAVMIPGTTNMGMGLLIDQLLGITGTVVLDAASFFATNNLRLNDQHRMNDGLRLSPSHVYAVTSTWNCFIVRLPIEISEAVNSQINLLVDRVRAAGNRKVATLTPTQTHFP